MPPTWSSLFVPNGDGWTFAVRVTPKASRNAIAGVDADQHGKAVLKVKVTATPEDGKANAAVIKLLARNWKVAKGSISIVNGGTNRNKTLRITCGIAIRDGIVTQLEEMER